MNPSQMINFGAGYLTLSPAGVVAPLQVGILQDVSIESSVTLKSLIGNLQFPVDIASAERKLSGKAKSGLLSSALYTNFYTGATTATGSTLMAAGEAASVPSVAAYTVTVAQAATWQRDLGVWDTTSGTWLDRAAAAAAGIYSVTAGVYTFASPQASHGLKMYYDYTQAGGQTVSITNQLMGAGTVFGLTLYNSYQGKTFGVRFPATIIGKLGSAMKNNDHTMTDIDFEMFADVNGNVAYKYFGQ